VGLESDIVVAANAEILREVLDVSLVTGLSEKVTKFPENWEKVLAAVSNRHVLTSLTHV
jgi:hypothetical protein